MSIKGRGVEPDHQPDELVLDTNNFNFKEF